MLPPPSENTTVTSCPRVLGTGVYSSSKEVVDLEQGHEISVTDVANAVPAESKEETKVLRDLDERTSQQIHTSLSSGILEGVPEEKTHVFASVRSSTATPQPDSVEEELHGLVGEMAPNRSISKSKTSASRANNWGKFGHDADKLIRKARAIHYRGAKAEAEETFADFKDYVSSDKETILTYTKRAVGVIFVCVAIAAILYYGLGQTGEDTPNEATTAWWFLFIARHVCTWTLAKMTQAVVIDFLCLRRPILLKVLGPYLTLLLVQSKGWPFHLVFYGLYNLALLHGNRAFARHWLYYQDPIHLFNHNNPAGDVTTASIYSDLIIYAMILGAAVSIKRFLMGLWYGQGIYQRYGEDLAAVMKKSLLIKKLAKHVHADEAKSKHLGGTTNVTNNNKTMEEDSQRESFHLNYQELVVDAKSTDDAEGGDDDGQGQELLINTGHRNLFGGGLAASQQIKIKTLLGEWEEPVTEEKKTELASLGAIVQFRTAISVLDKQYPFSTYFGLADKRESCIDSSQKLYLRLKPEGEAVLTFDRIAVIALKNGQLDDDMVKELIKIFRPTRDGELSMLDFVKSIDTAYKELRLLHASVLNLQKMNAAFQKLWDAIFYFFVAWIGLLVLQVDATALLASFGALVVSFSFMVGGAFSKAFEGLLLVLLRKPYDVGDRIAVASVDDLASGDGSSGWIVKDLDLYTTTLVFGTTGEEATFTNGYLNGYRIINMNRSPKAVLYITMKFGIDVNKDKIEHFGKAVEQYVKDRPREWISFSGYRLAGVEPDLGYVAYKIILQHRESWQQIGALLTSKADVQQFAFHLCKKLQMGYKSPPMPIILDQSGKEDNVPADTLFSQLSEKKGKLGFFGNDDGGD